MKLTALNWKFLAIVAGLILSTSLTACSTSSTPPAADSTKQGDAMKGDAMKGDGKGDAMKGDAMKGDGKGDAMKGGAMKGDAMKSDDKKTPATKP
ncbi:pentapeptide MXKDX repeat protein [Chamaesiphon sp.]|uniref:pentapeptide MXKDX repeat protein n=1 Tax=Chamaesiphon sp. TaxID=2814140 RepID=UPI0035933C24